MDTNDIKDVENAAKENYKKSEPWPDDDVWHSYTYKILHKHIQDYIDELQLENTQMYINTLYNHLGRNILFPLHIPPPVHYIVIFVPHLKVYLYITHFPMFYHSII